MPIMCLWVWPLVLAAILTPVGAPASPIPVVATTSILQDLVRNVGGPDVVVTTLVPPDGDAHVYEPVPSDVRTIADAKLLVENGLGLEPWLGRLVAASGYSGARIEASAGIRPLTFDDVGRKTDDPHAWQDAGNARIYVQNIEQALERIDPAHSNGYRQRAAGYDARLAQLDQKIRGELASIPAEKRRVMTTHDAFQYYGKAYGVAFIAPMGVSTEEGEPSAENLGRLEEQVEQTHIKALFLENMSDSRLIAQIARDTHAVLGPALYSDALSKSEGPAGTYIEMMGYNTRMLDEGMGRN